MLWQTFQAGFAYSFGKKAYFVDAKIGLHIFREGNIFPAGGLFAYFTVKMKVPVFVCIFVAAIVAKLVSCGRIFLDAVSDSFFLERFQGPVNGRSVGMFKMIFNFRQ